MSRLAYDLESLLSPMLAAVLLAIINFHWLFAGTSVGFIASALLVTTTVLPHRKAVAQKVEGVWRKTTRGMRIYLKTPRLVGLLAVTLAAAAGSAMVIVNTVVIVKEMGRTQGEVALALAAYGGGSMLAALALPRLLRRVNDRSVMILGAGLLAVTLAALGLIAPRIGNEALWSVLLAGWLAMGIAYSVCVTPGGRLLKRSAGEADRPALFAAQFTLSHVCWLIAYPVAGQVGALVGMSAAFLLLAAFAGLGFALALWLWPRSDPGSLVHSHPDLPADHPHLHEHGFGRHAHDFVIDDLHTTWPRKV